MGLADSVGSNMKLVLTRLGAEEKSWRCNLAYSPSPDLFQRHGKGPSDTVDCFLAVLAMTKHTDKMEIQKLAVPRDATLRFC